MGCSQKEYLAAVRELELARARRIVELVRRYDKALEGLQTRLTREDAVEDAVGASTTPYGKVGRGMRFNGEGSYVKIQPGGEKHAHVPIGKGDCAIFMWIRPDSVEGERAFFSQVNPTGAHRLQCGIEFGVSEDGKLMCMMIHGTCRKEESRMSIAEHRREWTHVGLVVTQGEEAKFFVNGKVADTIDISSVRVINMGASVTGGTAAWFDTLGARTKAARWGPNRFFDGTLDEFMIFTCAPTDAEVLQIYRATGGTSAK